MLGKTYSLHVRRRENARKPGQRRCSETDWSRHQQEARSSWGGPVVLEVPQHAGSLPLHETGGHQARGSSSDRNANLL